MKNQPLTAPLLLLPGLMCDAAFWQPLADVMPCQVVDYVDADTITAMQMLATHAQLSVIEDAGHMVLMERPEATVRSLRDFLEAAT